MLQTFLMSDLSLDEAAGKPHVVRQFHSVPIISLNSLQIHGEEMTAPSGERCITGTVRSVDYVPAEACMIGLVRSVQQPNLVHNYIPQPLKDERSWRYIYLET